MTAAYRSSEPATDAPVPSHERKNLDTGISRVAALLRKTPPPMSTALTLGGAAGAAPLARGDARGSSKGQCDIVNAYSNLATEPTSSSPVRAGHALPLQSELATREPCRERLCFEQKEPRSGGLRTCLPVVLSSSQAATPGHEQ